MAGLCDVSKRTYIEAERGRACTLATWEQIVRAASIEGITLHKLPSATIVYISDQLRDKIEARDQVGTIAAAIDQAAMLADAKRAIKLKKERKKTGVLPTPVRTT